MLTIYLCSFLKSSICSRYLGTRKQLVLAHVVYYFLDSYLISKLHATSALHNTDLTSQYLLAFGNALPPLLFREPIKFYILQRVRYSGGM
jgi:hypothetical protein